MKYFVECDRCNTLGQVPRSYSGGGMLGDMPEGWYSFIGPLSREGFAPDASKDICPDCAVELIQDQMSNSGEPDENSG